MRFVALFTWSVAITACLSLPRTEPESIIGSSLVEDGRVDTLNRRLNHGVGPNLYRDQHGRVAVLVPLTITNLIWPWFGSIGPITEQHAQAAYEFITNLIHPTFMNFVPTSSVVESITGGYEGTVGYQVTVAAEITDNLVNTITYYYEQLNIAVIVHEVGNAHQANLGSIGGGAKRDVGQNRRRGCSTKTFDFRPYIAKDRKPKDVTLKAHNCISS